MRGIASLYRMSFLPTERHCFTGSTFFLRSYACTTPCSMDAWLTKRMEVEGTSGANMGRAMTGCTVGMEALGSPFWRPLVTASSR